MTEILTEVLGENVKEPSGNDITGKRRLAQMMRDAALNGIVKFHNPNGTVREVLHLGGDDWIDTVKWIYKHLDGDAPKDLNVNAGVGGVIWDLTNPKSESVS